MRQSKGWTDRLRATLQTPIPHPGWRRFGIAAALLLAWKLAGYPRRDDFTFWVEDVGFTAFILAIWALVLLTESGKPEAPPEEHWTAGKAGIDVWMPLMALATFILGLFILVIATAQ